MPWKRMGWEEVLLLLILNLGTRWGWVVSITPRPRFSPGKRTPGTHCIRSWVDLRAGLDAEARGKILCPCRGSNPPPSSTEVKNSHSYTSTPPYVCMEPGATLPTRFTVPESCHSHSLRMLGAVPPLLHTSSWNQGQLINKFTVSENGHRHSQRMRGAVPPLPSYVFMEPGTTLSTDSQCRKIVIVTAKECVELFLHSPHTSSWNQGQIYQQIHSDRKLS
jgi:hypothetical protein